MMEANPIITLDSLCVAFTLEDGMVKALDGVSFSIYESETIGVVGESGSGKSVTALSILRLLPQPHGKVTGGSITFEGRNLLELSGMEMRKLRGNRISMIFQEPMSALNPVYSVGEQIAEPLRLHQGLSRKDAWRKAIEMLELVGISSPERRVDNYPHQLSGGMCQRVMIAMAIACQPRLMIADEPTTALDVTIQKQILMLMKQLQKKLQTSIMLITHNLGIIAEMAQRVIVMYAGSLLEMASVVQIFRQPRHPYTQGLLKALPRPDQPVKRLSIIPGMVPNLHLIPAGCKFSNRCSHVMEICREREPSMIPVAKDQWCRCWLYQ